ncbi:MAG: hypothetical protein R3B40_06625 [Polyangiales bacterium]
MRRSRGPDATVVSANASFPLSGRAHGIPPGAFLDELPQSAFMDDLAPTAFLDELSGAAPRQVAGARSAAVPADALRPPSPTPAGSACRRVDTCAWERVRAARVLAAWGVGR